jgi:D-alanyl-D-alanine carboxypeptidase
VGGRVLLVFALVLVVGCVDHGPAGLQRIADEAAELRGGYGFLVAVIDGEGGRTVGIAGTDATGAPLTEDVTWRIGSVTKAFVAVVTMQLVDEGHLSLDDLAATCLDYDFIPAEATILDLLHHSSGIPDYVENEEWVELMRSCPDEAPYPYDFVAEGPFIEPGSEWRYSNTNYLLLGEIIENVTGLPPETAIRHRILEPLGLSDTYTAYVETGRPPVLAVAAFFDDGPGPIECDTAPISGVPVVDMWANGGEEWLATRLSLCTT